MYQYFNDLQSKIILPSGVARHPSLLITIALCALTIIAAAALAKLICHVVCVVAEKIIVKHHALSARESVRDALVKHEVAGCLSSAAVPIVAGALVQTLPETISHIPEKIVGIIAVVVAVKLAKSALSAASDIYGSTAAAKKRPIKGIIQAAKAVVYGVAVLAAAAVIISRNPLALMGGVGAIAALLSFVFKDALLGLIAGINLTTSGTLRIGDHIQTENGVADGYVTDVALTTVKVRNLDLTESIIPAYTLTTGAFVNLRATEALTDGVSLRRICRSLVIDPADICFAVTEQDEENENAEFEPENEQTNIGALRNYMEAYTAQHPKITQEKPITARILQQTQTGIPIRLTAYAHCEDFSDYEQTMSELFEHFYARLPDFALSAAKPVKNITGV
ncbi:mechanosensitive ion channel protein MscS [Clostridia bacterium]|nr:mechanosensitive ion channel protein MscS [Clostridia bacterium]